MKRILLTIGFLAALGAPAQAQVYFGKNKVQYTAFDWQILTTDHFQIYFYPEEQWLAEVAAHAAESSYQELRVKFRHHIFSKVPIPENRMGNSHHGWVITPTQLAETVRIAVPGRFY